MREDEKTCMALVAFAHPDLAEQQIKDVIYSYYRENLIYTDQKIPIQHFLDNVPRLLFLNRNYPCNENRTKFRTLF